MNETVKKYAVESVQDTTYLDKAGQVVEGVLVQVYLSDFDEVRTVKLKNDDPETIRLACEELVSNREKIRDL